MENPHPSVQPVLPDSKPELVTWLYPKAWLGGRDVSPPGGVEPEAARKDATAVPDRVGSAWLVAVMFTPFPAVTALGAV